MTQALARREIQNNGQLQVQERKPLTRWEKVRAFCRGGLTEVSCRAIEKGGLSEEEQARHLERISRKGDMKQTYAALECVSKPTQKSYLATGDPYRSDTSRVIPERTENLLAERLVEIQTAEAKRNKFWRHAVFKLGGYRVYKMLLTRFKMRVLATHEGLVDIQMDPLNHLYGMSNLSWSTNAILGSRMDELLWGPNSPKRYAIYPPPPHVFLFPKS